MVWMEARAVILLVQVWVQRLSAGVASKERVQQGCGNTIPNLSDLVPFRSGQVENFNLLVPGQVKNLYKVAKILYFIF